MEAIMTKEPVSTEPSESPIGAIEVRPEMLQSPAVQRLLAEVHCEELCVAGKYDRTHNRHNR